jgi:hypothetical protein
VNNLTEKLLALYSEDVGLFQPVSDTKNALFVNSPPTEITEWHIENDERDSHVSIKGEEWSYWSCEYVSEGRGIHSAKNTNYLKLVHQSTSAVPCM